MTLYTKIVRAKIFIDKHYAEAIDLEKLADEACFSKFHFLRLFKQIYHQTPHQYLIAKRIDKAKDKLLNHYLSVADVCTQVGFESIPSFTIKFKERTGQTPTAYRTRMQLKNEEKKEHPKRFIPHCFAVMNKLKES